MKAADVSKWTYRDSGGDSDLASVSKPSRGWTAAQILTPILVAFVLCLVFVLYILYQRGRLSRLTFIFCSMRRRRQARSRGWTLHDDASGNGGSHHATDAEATPILNPPLHWPSLSPHDTTDDQHLSPRTRLDILMPAFSNAIRSMKRLFGGGPIPVSRAPASEAFDLEDSDTETDPMDTLRTSSSRSWRNGRTTPGRNSAPLTDRTTSTHNLASEASRSSAALDSTLHNGRGRDDDAANSDRDGGVDDNDRMDIENEVMLISRNGRDFSLRESASSVLDGRGPVEADRESVDVVPPTPQLNQPFRQSLYHVRSASTPHLHSLSSDASLIRSFSPSTDDLPNFRFRRPDLPLASPKPIPARPSASSNLPLLREGGALGAHYYTAATPPEGSVGPGSYRSKMAATLSLSPDARSHCVPADSSPPVSPQLQNYTPSFLGRPRPDSPYVPPSSFPSTPLQASDPQNLIPSAVRGAGYNPFHHARSASDIG
ncbi:hypothetical protein BJV74DRAFT_94302 [Russula compacta]|nr:hypothetical protein BJV74DRAFT_94302 [Russula compacta]